MEDRFLRGRQVAFMICEYFRVTGAHGAVRDYSVLFRITSHGDGIQYFDEIGRSLLSFGKFPMTFFWKLHTVIGHVRPRDQSNSIEAELSEADTHEKLTF